MSISLFKSIYLGWRGPLKATEGDEIGKKTTLIYEKVSPGDLGCMLQAENGSLA